MNRYEIRFRADRRETLITRDAETPLQAALVDFAWRILALSLVISLITATLVYLSLQWLLVRPMRRITASMTAFRDDPRNVSLVIAASNRRCWWTSPARRRAVHGATRSPCRRRGRGRT